MTDSTGAIVWSAYYKPFGEVTITTNTITNNLRFPGQYFDAETGLHYNYFRYYNPAVGRYEETDRIGQAGGINLYAYVGGKVTRYKDPKGLKVLNPNNEEISNMMQLFLDAFNNYIGSDKDIVITGGNRPPDSELGAGSGSTHTVGGGCAADIKVPGQSHIQTANQALQFGLFGGIGWYEEGYSGPNGEGPHVHVDLRDVVLGWPAPAFWGFTSDGTEYHGNFPQYKPKK